MMRFHIPIRLPSLMNTRMYWRRMAKVTKKQKEMTQVYLSIAKNYADVPPLPLLVTITRIGPRKLDDDNLASSCKYVRDQIAKMVGVDDGSDQYTWRYEQKLGEYGVDVEIITR